MPIELQHFKCGFCQRLLERSDYGNVEHDVDHFRRKEHVADWPPGSIHDGRDIRS